MENSTEVLMSFDAKLALAEIRADKKPSRGRKKGSRNKRETKFSSDANETKRELIRKIELIYKQFSFERSEESPLTNFSERDLQVHFNRLQWGQNSITKGVCVLEPEQIPENGFYCNCPPFHKIWTNAFYCQMRIVYPSLYPGCTSCEKWREHEEDSSSA
jgi:hypothetical protein